MLDLRALLFSAVVGIDFAVSVMPTVLYGESPQCFHKPLPMAGKVLVLEHSMQPQKLSWDLSEWRQSKNRINSSLQMTYSFILYLTPCETLFLDEN